MILTLLALLQAAAHSAPAPCSNARTQTDMNFCAAQRFRQADAALNTIWPRVLAQLRGEDQEAGVSSNPNESAAAQTLAAQRAWLTYRDAHCAAIGEMARGGSLRPTLEDNCRADLTEERVRELRELMTGMGG